MRESHAIPPGSPQSTSLLADLRLNLFMHPLGSLYGVLIENLP